MSRRESIGTALLTAAGGLLVAWGYVWVELGRAIAEPASRIEYVRVPDFVPFSLYEETPE